MDLEPGWRPDPTKHFPERYWDGQEWTDRVRDGDEEKVSSFEQALKLPISGEAQGPELHERRSIRLGALVAVVAAIGFALLVVLPNVLDGLPGSARAGTADEAGLTTTAQDIARAVTDGRFTIVAEYFPDSRADERSAIADSLRSCVDEEILGASIGGVDTAPPGVEADPGTAPADAVQVLVRLVPRPDVMANEQRLRLALRHDGSRWVLEPLVEYSSGDADFTDCVA